MPALDALPAKMYTPEASQMLIAIGLQETKFMHRWQVLKGGKKGAARSFWQFEPEGIRGVLEHSATKKLAAQFCESQSVRPEPMPVWRAMETNDALGAGFARLLLWTDPHHFPEPNDTEAAWAYYVRNWRPGKPRKTDWPANWISARQFVFGW